MLLVVGIHPAAGPVTNADCATNLFAWTFTNIQPSDAACSICSAESAALGRVA
jgi:hypothetical protein